MPTAGDCHHMTAHPADGKPVLFGLRALLPAATRERLQHPVLRWHRMPIPFPRYLHVPCISEALKQVFLVTPLGAQLLPQLSRLGAG